MRIVLDTNILVRANPMVSPEGLARDLLLTVISGPHLLVLSAPILVDQFLSSLAAVADMVESIAASVPVVISDPDDDPILQTAITGHADVLCTRDEAFRHEAVQRVCRAHNIRIADDVALMQEVRCETKP